MNPIHHLKQYQQRKLLLKGQQDLQAKGKAVDAVCLDFSKALETVSHSILLEKMAAHTLDKYTSHGENCLDGQAQRLMVNGARTRW